jgi:hypothetical protein
MRKINTENAVSNKPDPPISIITIQFSTYPGTYIFSFVAYNKFVAAHKRVCISNC